MITIYIGDLSTPLNCRPEQLASYLNQLSPNYFGKVTICESRARYTIAADVARALAYDYLRHGFANVQVCGESFPIENENDFINVFRKIRTERLYRRGVTILSNATTRETALREIAL